MSHLGCNIGRISRKFSIDVLSCAFDFFFSVTKGIDFPNVKVVCTAGLPSTIVDALQRGGRAIRIASVDPALFVVFYDPWALEIKKEEYTYGSPEDPDRPRKEQKQTSSRRDRAPLSSLQLVHTPDCLRAFYANYLADNAPEGKSLSLA
jgi:superfamily II DNA/RNA helicase